MTEERDRFDRVVYDSVRSKAAWTAGVLSDGRDAVYYVVGQGFMRAGDLVAYARDNPGKTLKYVAYGVAVVAPFGIPIATAATVIVNKIRKNGTPHRDKEGGIVELSESAELKIVDDSDNNGE